ncbi:hypothetical protein D3OALGA1CA_507 [Olavius algarvensis associated proteobacterium Delta 3]|nr:hypothetical protein D3OALGB2SA_431 [Olavius algarvensis associated proteobacterium Delta 3]CAB5084914.1 hypothetical protein D3OALGA1CA_507 [Olavius algarvensis associated proteobacterium Delta 3]
MSKTRIGIAVIAKNEADRITRLIESAAFADEIVVVDSGSSDGTPDLCRRMGARVIHQDWLGYAAQKQFALEAVSAEWILNLDADETVSEALAREMIRAISDADADLAGFSMPRLSRYLDRWIRHGGWFPDRKMRLVRRGRGHWSEDVLHEQLRVDGRTAQLTHPILHYVYRDISDHLATIDKFSDVYAEQRGPKKGWFVVAGVIHAMGKFIECYLWKKGLFDGLPGLIIAMNSSWYIFLKHSKAWEMSLPHATPHRSSGVDFR